MHGLLGTAPTGEDGQPVYDQRVTQTASDYGMQPAQVQQMQQDQRTQMFFKLAAGLAGAAQPGPVGQRGRMLAGLGDAIPGGDDMTKQIMNSAQARLYAESLKDKQAERQSRVEFMRGLKDGTLDIDPVVADRLKLLGPKSYDAYQTYIASSLKGKEYGPLQTDPVTKKQFQIGSNGEYKWAPTSGVTVNTGGEKEEDKVVGKMRGERIGEVEVGYKAGHNKLRGINTMQKMLDQIGDDGGKFFPMQSEVAAALKGLGANPDTVAKISGLKPGSLEAGQTFQKLASQALMELIGPGGFPAQNFSNADAERLERSIAQLSNEPGSNKMILEVQRQAAQSQIDASKDWMAYKRRVMSEGGKPDIDQWQMDYQNRLEEASKNGQDRFAFLDQLLKKTTGTVAPGTPIAPEQRQQALSDARDAIAKGAPRDKVIQELRQRGVDVGGL